MYDPYEEKLLVLANLTDQCLIALEKIFYITKATTFEASIDPELPIVEDLEFVGHELNKNELKSYQEEETPIVPNHRCEAKVYEGLTC